MHVGFNDTPTLETNGDTLQLFYECILYFERSWDNNLQIDEGFPHQNIPLTVHLAEDYIGIHGLK